MKQGEDLILAKKEKIPSPCVGVCKDRRGDCIACGRDKGAEKAWKKAESRMEKLRLIAECRRKTEVIGTRGFWEKEYRRKCAKKELPCPLDELDIPAARAAAAE